MSKTVPENMKKKQAYAVNQNELAIGRTEMSKVRTELALYNTRLAVDQTHLSYLRTIVSLVGSAATIFKALPMLGISQVFSSGLAGFLLIFAVYFIYKDIRMYPQMKKDLELLHERAETISINMEDHLYEVEEI